MKDFEYYSMRNFITPNQQKPRKPRLPSNQPTASEIIQYQEAVNSYEEELASWIIRKEQFYILKQQRMDEFWKDLSDEIGARRLPEGVWELIKGKVSEGSRGLSEVYDKVYDLTDFAEAIFRQMNRNNTK